MIKNDTKNFPVNLTQDELRIFKRVAYAQNISLGEFFRAAAMIQLAQLDFASCVMLAEQRSKRRELKRENALNQWGYGSRGNSSRRLRGA